MEPIRRKTISFLVILFSFFYFPIQGYAFGVSQREGAGGYQRENAQFVILPVQFSNFFYDNTQTQARLIAYHVKYDGLDNTLTEVWNNNSLQVYPMMKFIEDAKIREESNGRAVGQLYQDFAQVLKDSVSVLWPLLEKSKRFYLGRQFGNTLKRLPHDLTDVYFVVPMGLEFENEKHEVFGFLGIAVVDKEAEIVTAAAVRYSPIKYKQSELENEFRKLAKSCAQKLQKDKNPTSHAPRMPELKKEAGVKH